MSDTEAFVVLVVLFAGYVAVALSRWLCVRIFQRAEDEDDG